MTPPNTVSPKRAAETFMVTQGGGEGVLSGRRAVFFPSSQSAKIAFMVFFMSVISTGDSRNASRMPPNSRPSGAGSAMTSLASEVEEREGLGEGLLQQELVVRGSASSSSEESET